MLAFFVPGFACNQYGDPRHENIPDLVSEMTQKYGLNTDFFFADINWSHTGVLQNNPLDIQKEQIVEALNSIVSVENKQRLIIIGQSIGSMAVLLALCDPRLDSVIETKAVLLAPPTLEGNAHLQKYIDTFSNNPLSQLDADRNGVLGVAAGICPVDKRYWDSISRPLWPVVNSAVQRARIWAFFAENDRFYPDGDRIYAQKAPNIKRIVIKGSSHTFKDVDMKSQVHAELLRHKLFS